MIANVRLRAALVLAASYVGLAAPMRLWEEAVEPRLDDHMGPVFEAVCRDYQIDRSRIVLRGSSLGGVGSWQLGLKRPDRYVAIGEADNFVLKFRKPAR